MAAKYLSPQQGLLQDAYAARSHQRAAAATANGRLVRQIEPVFVPPEASPVRSDNGIRGDSTPDALAKLRSIGDPSHRIAGALLREHRVDDELYQVAGVEETARSEGKAAFRPA
mgnify:CR=1 FL=1